MAGTAEKIAPLSGAEANRLINSDHSSMEHDTINNSSCH